MPLLFCASLMVPGAVITGTPAAATGLSSTSPDEADTTAVTSPGGMEQ